MEPPFCVLQGKFRVRRAEPQVACKRQLKAARDCKTVDGCDDGFEDLHVARDAAKTWSIRVFLAEFRGRALREIHGVGLEIRARAESLVTRTRDHRNVGFVIGVELAPYLGQAIVGLEIQRVHFRGAVDGDEPYTAVDLIANVAHGVGAPVMGCALVGGNHPRTDEALHPLGIFPDDIGNFLWCAAGWLQAQREADRRGAVGSMTNLPICRSSMASSSRRPLPASRAQVARRSICPCPAACRPAGRLPAC